MANAVHLPARRRARGFVTRALTALLAAALLTGCGLGSGDDDTPGSFQYAGNWRGSVTDEDNGSGTLLVTLQQSNHELSGTWHVVMANDAARQDGGSWAGELFVGQDRDVLEATLNPAVAGECSYTLTLSRTAESLSGTYAARGDAVTCAQLVRGTVQLTKQL